ncbi:hypothetical protein LCGC14_1408500 [marine sediment metagenome]|uniref:Uncharacterized protein n=1 Tax=marine sediment metagenome TaxID=412755 RepID=A0A0F9JUY2_9ZZZZ
MIRFIWRHWRCGKHLVNYGFEIVSASKYNTIGYRGALNFGPFAIDWWAHV